MNKFICGIWIVIFHSFITHSQVLNIDRVTETDSISKKIRAYTTLSFSNEKQKKALIDFTNKTELNYFLPKKYLVVFLSQVDMAFNGKTINENNGFFQARFRDNDSRKISPDVFTQYQWNGIQGMEYRFLNGINARFKFLEKKKSDLYTGIGVFYEAEKWNPNLPSFAFKSAALNTVYRNMFRLNCSAKFAIKLSKAVDFSGSTFVQFPLNAHFGSSRWFFDSNLNFNVSKYWSFILHYDHNFDAFRPLPIDQYYYAMTLGIQLKV